ncbi:MAG: phosphoribosyltransferase family protein [Pseudomonadota bacterium]
MSRVDPLFDAATLAHRIDELARDIRAQTDHSLVVVPLLKGSFMFAADLLRALHRHGLDPDVDFMTLSSYGTGTSSGGEVLVRDRLMVDLRGRDVLLVDDILETGATLACAIAIVTEAGARAVTTCVLLDKSAHRTRPPEAVAVDHIGFVCPDEFVVGYGLDHAHRHRGLPFVGRMVENA